MKALVIGNLGSIGSRYCAILKYLGVDWVGVDIQGTVEYDDITHAIIATPTETHYEKILQIASLGIDNILCEKPLVQDLKLFPYFNGIRSALDIRMVCNWKYALPPGALDIHYANYNTGKDGTGWDCIQLIYLARNLTIDTEQPFFSCKTVDPTCNCKKDISLTDIEQSYITMIKHWLELDGFKNDLWDLSDSLKATEKTLKWIKENE